MNPLLQPYVQAMHLDEASRIVVTVQPMLQSYLSDPNTKKSIKDSLMQILGSDFIQLEMSSKGGRITVTEGKAESSMALIEQKVLEGLSMAMEYMQKMQK